MPSQTQVAARAAQQPAPLHVLVADDDPIQRLKVCDCLARYGLACVEAADGADALRRLESAAFDLVITDIFMPMKDGLEFIGLVRVRWPALPVIAVSGGWERIEPRSILDVASALGASAALPKPLDEGALLAAVHSLTAPDLSPPR